MTTKKRVERVEGVALVGPDGIAAEVALGEDGLSGGEGKGWRIVHLVEQSPEDAAELRALRRVARVLEDLADTLDAVAECHKKS